MTQHQQPTFRFGDPVEVTIRGNLVRHTPGSIAVSLSGVAGNVYTLPLLDDREQPLDAVTVTAWKPTDVRPGDVWRSREFGFVFLATEHDGRLQLVTPENKAIDVAEAARLWGPLDLVLVENCGQADDAEHRGAMFQLPRPEGPTDVLPEPAAAAPAPPPPAEDLPVYQTCAAPPNAADSESWDAFHKGGARAIEAGDPTTILEAVPTQVPVTPGHPGPPEHHEVIR